MIYLDKQGLEHYHGRINETFLKKSDKITCDEEVTEDSTNPVESQGIKRYVDAKIAEVVQSAPEALDTLQELADALGNDENFAATVSQQIGEKVDKVEGKGLSTEDYTTEEKTKLEGIEDGAQVNTVTGVKGEAEDEFRVGEINITKADLGLDSVDNTADGEKSVKTAEKLAEARQISISDGENGGDVSLFDGSEDLTLMLPTNIHADLSGLAEKATNDAEGNEITSTYETKSNAITEIRLDGTTLTYVKGDGATESVTTQDTHYKTKKAKQKKST